MTGFGDRLVEAVARRKSQVVLGLDPHPEQVPGGVRGAEDLCSDLIAAAGPACVGVKIQLACFERHGAAGWAAWQRLAERAARDGLVVIADAKRGDIGISSVAYADALLREPVDAVTVNPLLGDDGVAPFISAAAAGGRGVFMLVRTSNPGAAALQDAALADGRPWHEELASLVAGWGASSVGTRGLSAVGAVVGATVPERLGRLRELMPAQPFLIPGVGAQGGEVAALGPAFTPGPAGGLVSASRSLMFADDPARAAEELRVAVARAAGV